MIRPRPLVHFWNLGRLRYLPSLRIQQTLVKHMLASRDDAVEEETAGVVLLVEHDPVYTTGIRTKVYSAEEEHRLRSLGADFVRTNRGGLITFHGHGQLVAYPILDLKHFIPETAKRKAMLGNKRRDIFIFQFRTVHSHSQLLFSGMKWYVHTLEQVVIDLCASRGLASAQRSPHTGVWIGDRKICAMGVHNKSLVTSHGIALNCSTDLKWYSHIVPCGIPDKGVTSLSEELGQPVSPEDAIPNLKQTFSANFKCDVRETLPEPWCIEQSKESCQND